MIKDLSFSFGNHVCTKKKFVYIFSRLTAVVMQEEILSETLRKRDKRNPCCAFKYILREKLLDLV